MGSEINNTKHDGWNKGKIRKLEFFLCMDEKSTGTSLRFILALG